MTSIQSRQQVQHLCNQLANSKRIRRESVEKAGKRRKIHNFPVSTSDVEALGREDWHRRLSALVAATDRTEADLLNEALHLLAMKILKNTSSYENPQE
jgi:hypothetical protein